MVDLINDCDIILGMKKFIRRNTQDKQLQRTLYFAYGMNTNHDEMSTRCPDSIFLGTAKMFNHKLTFQGVADYTEAKGYTLHGALWLISSSDERALDRLEGYPHLYTKHIKKVQFCNRDIDVMIYQMVDRDNFSKPNLYYENCLRKGYRQSGMNKKQIDKAVSHATECFIKKQAELRQIDLYDTEYQESIEELDFTNSSYIPARERIKWIR